MRRFYIVFALLLYSALAFCAEGMWLPQLLSGLNMKDMSALGLKLKSEDIYSINHSSLKDAIVQFGGGCTGEIISAKGLVLTNHHCGFSQIQSLSTIEKNYLKDGFWADSFETEIPCPGLTVTFIREITDVTSAILDGINDTTNEDRRALLVRQRSDSLEKTIGGRRKGFVRSFYYGNKFYLFNTEVFSDIRFVGAPPQEIGKFGGEIDNWIWPRHTGDFSLFRIYANKDNEPASYSADNIPYTPEKSLKINMGGIKENDFIMVYGFPGRTNEYLLSPGLELINNQTNPNRVEIREKRLEILRKEMSLNDTVKLQYAAKFSTIENSYKKWKGELFCFKRFNVIEKKKAREEGLLEKFRKKEELAGDTTIIELYSIINNNAKRFNSANDYYVEAFPGIEMVNVNSVFKNLVALSKNKSISEDSVKSESQKIIKSLRGFYKNFNKEVDRQFCSSLISLVINKVDRQFLPSRLSELSGNEKNRVKFIDQLYSKSLVADSSGVIDFLRNYKKSRVSKILKDPAYQLYTEISAEQSKITASLGESNTKLNKLMRRWMGNILAVEPPGKIYPDANGTLRISYGKVEKMKPYDAITYNYYTTAAGIVDKFLSDPVNYSIPLKLGELIRNKDFGDYGKNGVLPVAFIATTHTTGGNSGSPCLNAKGELAGINFDRVWEGIASDYYYSDELSRNICVDSRYILFIIDKLGNAERIIKELNIVKK